MDRELLTMIWRTVIGPLTVTLGKSFTGYKLPPNTWMIWTLLWGNAKSKFLKDIFKHCFVKITRQSVLQKKGRVEEWFYEVVAYAICRYYQGSSIAFHATKYPICILFSNGKKVKMRTLREKNLLFKIINEENKLLP